MANFTGEKAQTTLENVNSVKKLQISGYPIIEYEHIADISGEKENHEG